MKKAYEFRIYPTLEQEEQFKKANGLCRLYWNTCLAEKNEAFSKGENYSVKTFKGTFEKTRPEVLEWGKEVDSTIFAAEWKIITGAWNNFFKSAKKQNLGNFGKPQFKSKKKDKVSITFTSQNKPRILKNGYLFLTRKLGPIKGVFHRWVEGEMLHATISQTKTGKWFVKICVDKKEGKKNKNGKSVGIDWNCDDESFISMSNGTKVKCPRFLRQSQKQLKHQQRILSRKMYSPFFQKYGRMPELKNPSDAKKFKECFVESSNYLKQKYKVAKLHEKVANQRKDWLHKLSRQICNEYETVVVEDIDLRKMASELRYGKVVGDQGFGMLRTMIAYKGNLVKVNPKNTSKTCHCCGFVNPKVVLGVKKWECPNCGASHDRDINAALNILHKWNATSQSIVGRELAENTNASGELKSSMKEEILLTGVYNNRQQGGEAIESLAQ